MKFSNSFQTINPVNNTIIKNYTFFDRKHIINTLFNSHNAFKKWRKYSLEYKISLIHKLVDIMNNNIQHIANSITQEMGKPILQSKIEVEKSIDLCKYYINNINRFNFKQKIYTKNINYNNLYIRYESIGTILVIVPWNYPVWQIFRSSLSNLIIGNVVLIKPSLNTIGTSILLEKLFINTGFIEGIFQILKIKNSDIEYIISNDIIKGVVFTGSTNSGKIIGSLSGKYIKKSILELGGNDAFVILKDTKKDLEKIVKIAIESRLYNTGQSCIAAKRFIVDVSLIKDFIDLAIQEMKSFKKESLYKETTKIGYIARCDLSEKLYKQYKYIISYGGKIYLESIREDNFFSPSLLQVDYNNLIIKEEEIFGPIGIVIPFYNENDITYIVNNTVYGLGASIWTNNINKAEYLSEQIETGMVFINETVNSYPSLPFGGIKKSGYGKELSLLSITEFSNCKTIIINNL